MMFAPTAALISIRKVSNGNTCLLAHSASSAALEQSETSSVSLWG
jgi:hypothetical protein